jgi:hypothetical protein
MAVWTRKSIRGMLRGMLAATSLFLLVLAAFPFFQGQAQADSSSIRFRTVERGWDDLSPTERERALNNFKRFQQLPGDRKRDLQNAYDRWQKLPGSERQRIQENYKRYREMNSEEKEQFRLKYKHWQSQQR